MNQKYLEKAKKRFWSKVDKRGEGECWEWQASRFPKGYGRFGFNGKVRRAHRVAWELIYGAIPIGFQVLHDCDNPKCVNPKHLFLGTQLDNMQDMVGKGRKGRGNAKLTIQQVVEIREKYAHGGILQRELGEKYGVALNTISSIIAGTTWSTCTGRLCRQHSRKLTNDQVVLIRKRYIAGGVSQRELGKEYGITQGHISAIILGKYWVGKAG